MELFIIRHGQSAADLLGVHEGRADFELTALGRGQAQAMAGWVAARHCLDMIFASPLKRAWETAQILGRACGLAPTALDDLMEYNNGLLAGMGRKEAGEKYPQPAFKPPHAEMYGMESQISFRMRVERALSHIIHDYPADSRIAVVCHGGTINMLYHSLLGLPVGCDTIFYTGDTGIHHWRLRDGRRAVVAANSLAHLDGQAQ